MLLLKLAGFIQFYAGGQQPDQKVTVPSNILQGQFEIVGKQILSPHWINLLNYIILWCIYLYLGKSCAKISNFIPFFQSMKGGVPVAVCNC